MNIAWQPRDVIAQSLALVDDEWGRQTQRDDEMREQQAHTVIRELRAEYTHAYINNQRYLLLPDPPPNIEATP